VALNRQTFVKSNRLYAECLIKNRDELGTEVYYQLERGTQLLERRIAKHGEKARLHRYVNEHKSLPSYPITRMHKLLNALAVAIQTHNDNCRPEFDRREWRANLQRAKRLVARGKVNEFAAIVSAIIPQRRNVKKPRWRKLVCRSCRTWLLFGYVLDGQKITRSKQFCSDSCRVKAARMLHGWATRYLAFVIALAKCDAFFLLPPPRASRPLCTPRPRGG
jgi:hypothetical protein